MDPIGPTAFSYVRFSSKKQEEGDSIRRQTELTAAWAKRNAIHLDTSLAPDRGISSFRGRNRSDLGALGAFLRLVESGRVPPGSYLVVESLDRLTREEIQPALLLVLTMLQKGVRVVQLKPIETVYDSKSDTTPIILMLVELSRGHSESKVKSDRVAEAWSQRRKNAREGTALLTNRLPKWVEVRNGKLVAIPERAAVVRRIFKMSLSGMGLYAIMTTLMNEKVPGFGRSGRWSVTYLSMILSDRRALGEFQPRLRNGDAAGEPIADYFPAVVTEEQWELVRAGARKRHRKPGRIGNRVNVFQGLIKSARDGYSYFVGAPTGGSPYPVLRSSGYRLGMGSSQSLSLETFERAVLSCLREVDPQELLAAEPAGRPDEAAAIAAELARVEASIGAITAEMDERGESPALFRRLRDKEAAQRAAAAKLAAVRQKAAHPLSESWDETKSLLAALDAAPDQRATRLRLREALRRVVTEIRLLVVPVRRDRLAAVQIWFAGENESHRDYLVHHRAALVAGKRGTFRRPSGWSVRSFAGAGGGGIDLREPEDVAAVEKALGSIDAAGLSDVHDHAPVARPQRKK